jgi:hypothetical protein
MHHKSILGPLFTAIAALNPSLQRYLINWWSQYDAAPPRIKYLHISLDSRMPSKDFLEFVRSIQNFITLRIILPPYVEHLNRDEPIISATKVLGILSTPTLAFACSSSHLLYPTRRTVLSDCSADVANERVTPPKIEFSEFYNEMVNESFDPREDFVNWKESAGYAFCFLLFLFSALIPVSLATFARFLLE